MKQKHWYDYLWIWSIVYFTLGLFNILFAWLGMIDFLVPLFISLGTVPDWIAQFSFGFYSIMLTSTIIGLAVMILFKSRIWCTFCPMGTMTQIICKLKAGEKL